MDVNRHPVTRRGMVRPERRAVNDADQDPAAPIVGDEKVGESGDRRRLAVSSLSLKAIAEKLVLAEQLDPLALVACQEVDIIAGLAALAEDCFAPAESLLERLDLCLQGRRRGAIVQVGR